MKRILLMVIRNLIFVPYWWIKLCWYAAHTDDYPEEKKYTFLRHVDEHAIEGGNIHIDVHGAENIPKENNTSPVQEYIDEIRQELENEEYSGRYSKKRNEHYRQDSIRHQRDKKEQTLDSLKSTFYSGKSSVSYNLKNRYALFLPIPIFKCEFGGTVVVNIEVNRKGIVQRAEVVRNLSEQDDCLYEVAVDAALRSKFNPRPDAELLQVGTITFHFVKQ